MNLLIIGDSHTLRLRSSKDSAPPKECLWNHDTPRNSACIENHLGKSKNLPIEIYYSGHKGKTGYAGTYYKNNNYPCLSNFLDEKTIVLPWFGYIDIKQFLPVPEFKKSEDAVSNYIDKTLEYFKNNKVRFIEPLPQFINAIGTGYPRLSFEERQPHYKEFLQELRAQCDLRGLEKPINIEDVLGVDSLDESFECHECNDCLANPFKPLLLDHPKKVYFEKILDAIIKEYAPSID
jgi:hypothetical protein